MPSKKIKISELPLVESLKGLYTIGYKIIDGIKTSVKVSLEDIQTAYQDVVNAVKNSEVATKNANTAASNANEKAVLADTAAANANDTAEHPTYIGQDHYVYKWNKTAQAYDKTDIYTKGDAFSIKKVYASVANMEADKSNPDITEGDFVLVNTGDVEDPDNAKLYVKADGDFEFLVDMSGAIGFTGKTPQFSIGTISTLEAGSTATATISEDGVDSDGNPKYKINFAIPRGNPGAPFRIAGEYATLEALKSAVPDGSAVDGFMAVGTEAPYDYYAWVNGDWVNQGKIAGGGSGNVVVIPAAAMSLSDQATPDEIFNAFGGKQNLIDIIKKVKDEDCVVIAKTDDDPNAVLQHTPLIVNATYINDNNLGLGLASWSIDVTSQIIIQVIDGVASYNEISTPLMTEAPSDGNVYGRKNKDWVEVPEKSDVLTKDNETEYTPTEPYHPATKKYVDDSISTARSVGYMMQLTEIDASGLDEDTWYPVTISAYERMNIRVEVLVSLDSGTKPSWSTHAKGFSTRKIWEFAPNAWGVNHDSVTTIYLSDFVHADVDPVRGLNNMSHFNICFVYVRGGGKYYFYASHNADVILHTDTYKPSEGSKQSVSPTTETPAEIVANIATKEYVGNAIYGKTINADSGTISNDLAANGTNLTGVDAEERVMRYFGNLANFRSVVQDIVENHTRYFIHSGNDCRELGCLNAWKNTGNTEHELHFILTGYGDGNLHTKRYSIRITNNTADAKFIMVNIVSSDNLTTLTKKTSSEYEAISPKDANTAYCVTD